MQLTEEELIVAKKKYKEQSAGCRARVDRLGNPIQMKMAFEDWLGIWLTSGHWHERGTKRGQYVMSRFNDIGHYEIGNVEIKTVRENTSENNSSPEFRAKMKELRNSPEYQTKMKEVLSSPEHRAKLKELRNSPKYKAIRQVIMDSSEYKAARQAMYNSDKYRESHKQAVWKTVSCDNILYDSGTIAAIALAPENRISLNSKRQWLKQQMKKYPNRYFYVDSQNS